ncbi:hypothetical protein L596_003827 [Steinernema carpocapsae]|uniref:Transposase Tc5 C-terminal domain-containing protein n=1 Tax=Steinernema carpocapsae TaxID=34508 RepID=A0A4U8UUV7_STECR|nr:hypothetical protein L596_003827 [Steinernema carpocapsae]
MMKYPWFKCGYLDQRPALFVTPAKICFGFDGVGQTCAFSNCTDLAAARCSHCAAFFCLEHFVIKTHFC